MKNKMFVYLTKKEFNLKLFDQFKNLYRSVRTKLYYFTDEQYELSRDQTYIV